MEPYHGSRPDFNGLPLDDFPDHRVATACRLSRLLKRHGALPFAVRSPALRQAAADLAGFGVVLIGPDVRGALNVAWRRREAR